MSRVYLIKPLEKKSIVWRVEMYRDNVDGTISWFNIEETYRWGQGFIEEEDMYCNLPYEGDFTARANNNCGWGSDLEDLCSCEWSFSDDMTEEEQDYIKECYDNGSTDEPDISGAAWLFDGSHAWKVEDDWLEIIAPYQVSLCEDDGTVVEEKVELKPRTRASNAWPF